MPSRERTLPIADPALPGEVDAEEDTSDDEPEPDAPGLRRRFIVERQEPPRERRYVDQDGRECHFLVPSRYNATKDQDELRKVKSQLNALAAKKRKRGEA